MCTYHGSGYIALSVSDLKVLGRTYSQLQNISLSSSESEAECPDCGLVYGEDESTWIQCDSCGVWRDLVCAGVSSVSDIPEMFCCQNCT